MDRQRRSHDRRGQRARVSLPQRHQRTNVDGLEGPVSDDQPCALPAGRFLREFPRASTPVWFVGRVSRPLLLQPSARFVGRQRRVPPVALINAVHFVRSSRSSPRCAPRSPPVCGRPAPIGCGESAVPTPPSWCQPERELAAARPISLNQCPPPGHKTVYSKWLGHGWTFRHSARWLGAV